MLYDRYPLHTIIRVMMIAQKTCTCRVCTYYLVPEKFTPISYNWPSRFKGFGPEELDLCYYDSLLDQLSPPSPHLLSTPLMPTITMAKLGPIPRQTERDCTTKISRRTSHGHNRLESRRAEVLHCMRCTYLCRFSGQTARPYVESVFADIKGEARTLILAHFIKRCTRNVSNWQY